MKPTTITQYSESLASPEGLFRTLGTPVCERDPYGDPAAVTGGRAAVYRIAVDGRRYALRCYLHGCGPDGALYGKLAGVLGPDAPRLLREEMCVFDCDGRSRWCDVVIAPWREGRTLEYEIRRAVHYRDGGRLAVLADRFDRMALGLLRGEWAHGDLKPSNIIVTPGGGMNPIDFDAAWFPGTVSREAGTPGYRHPRASVPGAGKYIDDYPIAMISSTLRTLAADPSAAADVRAAEGVLFDPLCALQGASPACRAAASGAAARGDAVLYNLLAMLGSPDPQLPGLVETLAFGTEGALPCPDGQEPSPFVRGGKWGCAAGEREIIPPLFDAVTEFRGGEARITIGDHIHRIGPDGKIRPAAETLSDIQHTATQCTPHE